MRFGLGGTERLTQYWSNGAVMFLALLHSGEITAAFSCVFLQSLTHSRMVSQHFSYLTATFWSF